MKKILALLLLFILIFESALVLTSCGGLKVRSEGTIRFLTEEDYVSGSYEDKLTDSISVGSDEKAYVVLDFKIKNLKKAKKKKGDRVLTACFSVTCSASDKAEYKCVVEDFPTNNYKFNEEKSGSSQYKSYSADIVMLDSMGDTLDYRFIFSISKTTSATVKIYSGLSFRYESADISEGTGSDSSTHIEGEIVVDESIKPLSKLDYELANDGDYYKVIGTGMELENKIIIPETHNDIPVKEIADNAFINVNSIKEIVIPKSIVKIGANAFKGCTDVENFIIPSSVTEIGSDAFAECPDAMIWCEAAKKPSGWNDAWCETDVPVVWKSGDFFTKDSGATTYTFTFRDEKFPYDRLSVPESYLGGFVTTISGNGIHDAVSIVKSLKIPSKVTKIGEYAFHNCYELNEIRFNAENCAGLDSKKPSFAGAGKNTEGIAVSFGSTVKNVPFALFYVEPDEMDDPNITTVSVGALIEVLGSDAFKECTSLVTAYVLCKEMGTGVFAGCSSLASVTLGDELTKIGNTAFRYCTSLKNVIIPKNVISIGNYAFDGCTSLETVRFAVPFTWYVTEYSMNSDPSEATQLYVMVDEDNAGMITDTYHDKHWFRR